MSSQLKEKVDELVKLVNSSDIQLELNYMWHPYWGIITVWNAK